MWNGASRLRGCPMSSLLACVFPACYYFFSSLLLAARLIDGVLSCLCACWLAGLLACLLAGWLAGLLARLLTCLLAHLFAHLFASLLACFLSWRFPYVFFIVMIHLYVYAPHFAPRDYSVRKGTGHPVYPANAERYRRAKQNGWGRSGAILGHGEAHARPVRHAFQGTR